MSHRLKYSKKEFDLLLSYLGPLDQWLVRDLGFALKNIRKDPNTDYDHKQIYDTIKYNTIQRVWQAIYHTPLRNIPLHMNSKDPIVQCVVKWRLAIAR